MKKLILTLFLISAATTTYAKTTTDTVFACFYASPLIEIMEAMGNQQRQQDVIAHYSNNNKCLFIKEGVDIVILNEAFRRWDIYKIGVTIPKTGKVVEMYSHPAFLDPAGIR